jgi:hypothetical protein
MERHENRTSTYRFTLPVFAGEPVDPDGLIPMYQKFVREQNQRARAWDKWTGFETTTLRERLRLRVRGRLGRKNPFAKMIDFSGARDIDLMYAQRCDVYVEVRA